MCEVSGNRGILILIRQLPTGPSNRPRDARGTAQRARAAGWWRWRGADPPGGPGRSKILSKMQNLTKISVSAARNALASGSSLSSEGDLGSVRGLRERF